MANPSKKIYISLTDFHLNGGIIMKKIYVVLLIIFGVIALAVIGAIVVFTMPKDLGVKYTKADLDSVNNKLEIKYSSLAASNDPVSSIKISGKQPIDQQITESEMTALLNQPEKQWKNYPVKNVQMKINADGSVEMTGKIIAGRFEAYSKATNMPDKYTSLVEDKAGLVPVNPSFYYKGNYAVKNNKLEGEISELKVGPLTVPKDWTENNKDFINDFVADRLNSAGMQVESATFTDGKLDIKGTIPESIDFEK
jgi:hypothetical protein